MRMPAVAGRFYPGSAGELKRELASCFEGKKLAQRQIKAAIVPHAGYVYSGNTAAHVYAVMPEADTFVLVGPKHTHYGSPIAVSKDTWSTPLGAVESDMEFINALPKNIIDVDEEAHRYEHSIEVQLPFLQHRFEKFKIAAICIGLHDEESLAEVGAEIAHAAGRVKKRVVLIASSDFTHFEPEDIARETDTYVIKPILTLDAHEFYRRIFERSASVCGFAPIMAVLTAAKTLGATQGVMLDYSTSADASGDRSSVVGYAGIVVE